MAGAATARVQTTESGAIIYLRANDPAQVAQVQRMAQRMGTCISGGGPAAAPAR